MRWGVLGPLSVTDDAGTDIRVPAGRLQTLLAVLLMRANQPVPLDEIVDILWEGTPPTAAARTVRVYVARLRQVLGPNSGRRILTRSHGYLCGLEQDEFDRLRFEMLCRQARTASREGSWSRAADLLTDALAQWRGAPLADIPSESLRVRECPRLERLRQQAIEDLIDARPGPQRTTRRSPGRLPPRPPRTVRPTRHPTRPRATRPPPTHPDQHT